MDERDLGSGRGLIIRERSLRERLVLSEHQQQLVGELALRYLRRNKLDFNRENLQAAFGVLAVDALFRGLLFAGKTEVLPSDNIRLLIKNGLANRAAVQAQTQEALQITHKGLLRDDDRFLGPLALPRELVDKAQQEFNRFLLTPMIDACDELVYQCEVRKQLLPEIAGFAISTLPKENYPEASTDKFPALVDQAKIARNMLTSVLFRGTPQPAIWIEDLRTWAMNKQKIREALDRNLLKEVLDQVASGTGYNQDDLLPLIAGLLYQTQRRFFNSQISESPPVSELQLVEARDKTFRQFSDVLLLLHPALEETEIATTPQVAKGTSYSIWREDLSIGLDGLRIPTPLGLTRAIRGSEAKGYSGERFGNGIRAWRDYERGLTRENTELRNLEKELWQVLDSERELEKRPGSLPEAAFKFMELRGAVIHKVMRRAQSVYRSKVKTIDTAREERTSAENYVANLRDTNQGEIPAKTTMPEAVKEQRVRRLERRRRNILRNASNKIQDQAQAIREDFVSMYRIFGIENKNWSALSEGELKEEITRLKSLRRVTRFTSEVNLEFLADLTMGRVFPYVERQLELAEFRIKNKMRQAGDKKRLEELRLLRRHLSPLEKKGSEITRFLAKRFAMFVLTDRQRRLEEILSAKGRLESNAGLELSASDSWTRDEIVYWLRSVRSATLPLDGNFEARNTLWQMQKDLEQFMEWYKSYPEDIANIGPVVITSKDDFAFWLEGRIADLTTGLQRVPTKHGKRYIARQIQKEERLIENYSQFREILDNPIFPFNEASGLSREDFWRAVFRRRYLYEAILTVKDAKREYENVLRDFKKVAWEEYQRYLRQREMNIRNEIVRLSAHPARRNFIARMRELNLVLPEDETFQNSTAVKN